MPMDQHADGSTANLGPSPAHVAGAIAIGAILALMVIRITLESK